MRGRIWEDPAAMSVVSVLGFLMNDDGDVVGAERTQVLCKLLPSIHTLTHRAILAMLISGLSNADAQMYGRCFSVWMGCWSCGALTTRAAAASTPRKGSRC